MFYKIQGKDYIPYSLDNVKDTSGSRTVWYNGTDELYCILRDKWRWVEETFFDRGENFIIQTPGIKSGLGNGNNGYTFPRIFDVRSRNGARIRMAWAENIEPNPKDHESPVKPFLYTIKPTQKALVLEADDIEEILFHLMANPELISPTNTKGKSFVEDKEADAEKFAKGEERNAIINYWLFTQGIGFHSDEKRVNTLCLAWGISGVEKYSLARKKQMLSESVRKYEKAKDVNYGLDQFNETCKKLSDGSDVRDLELLSLVQRCLDKKVLKFIEKELEVKLIAEDGKPLKRICKVPPQMTGAWKLAVKNHLVGNPDDTQTLYDAIGDTSEEAQPRVQLSKALPDEITEDWIKDDMPWHDKRAMVKFLGHDLQPSDKADVLDPILIEKLVICGQKPNWELKKKD